MMKPLNTAASLMPVLLLAANCQAATALPSYNLDEVIVTATRVFTPQSQVSSSTEVITREDIQKKNAQTLGDIIGSYAGVSVARESNRKSLSMRGVDAKYSLLLIDGMRMPSEPDKNRDCPRTVFGPVWFRCHGRRGQHCHQSVSRKESGGSDKARDVLGR